MIDVEQRLRVELDALLPDNRPLDWGEVLDRAGGRRSRRRSPWALAAVGVATVAVVALATPLGGAMTARLGDFSAWLRGNPGRPASTSEQRAFDRSNARSWLRFPAGTRLRRLAEVSVPSLDERVDLLGFRSGSTLCLRIALAGTTTGGAQSCAPVADLRRSGTPVRVVLVDRGFGQGKERAWYGVDRLRASALQITAGIAADDVRRVRVQDDSGTHAVGASENAFLYVAPNPAIGQRVRRIWADTPRGLVRVPFASAAFGPGGIAAGARRARGPSRVERRIANGTIGWLDRREARGRPLSAIPGRDGALIRRHTVFGGVVAPDPSRPVRIALTLSTSRHGGRATGLCTWLLQRNGSAGGCAVRANVFANSPIVESITTMGGPDEYATASGIASDDVDHIVAFLADGEQVKVPLADNTYLVDIARSKLPARLVAYDSAGRTIGIAPPVADDSGGAGPARGKARPLRKVVSATGAAELLVGPSTAGGRCFYVRYHRSARVGGIMVDCGQPLHEGALALGTPWQPSDLVMGRVGASVARVRLAFADGATLTVAPTRGFVLSAIPASHTAAGHDLVSARALDRSGEVIGQESLRPPKG